MSTVKTNAQVAVKQYSTYVVVALVAAIGWWMGLPPEQQQALMKGSPWLAALAPYLGGIAFVIAKLWPQGVTVPAPKDEAAE